MKRIIVFSMLALVVILSGCSKDHLDIDTTGSVITDHKIQKYNEDNPSVGLELQNALFKGLYSWMYTPEAGGTSGDADFGQKSVDLYLDILCGDFVKSNNDYGWFGDTQELKVTADKTRTSNYTLWRYYYRLVFTANSIFDGFGGDNVDISADKPALRASYGQALAVRAYAYFYITQIFGKEYNPSANLAPLYRNVTDINNPVTKQSDFYDLIIQDLTKAIEYLDGFKRSNVYEADQDVAKAYLAYTYAAMGNYAEVERITEPFTKAPYQTFAPKDIVYNPAEDPMDTKNGGFNDANLPGVLWGVDLNSDMNIDLYSWWGQTDMFTYSYAAAGEPKVISDRLFNQIREDDIRKGQFNNPGARFVITSGGVDHDANFDLTALFGGYYNLLPINKFYPKQRKFMAQRKIESDYIYLRVDEMVLLNAEAKAFQGKDAEAKAVLKNYLNGRIADLSYIDALSGDALKDEIYLQTRIEFLGEGKSYLALKRFKKDAIFGSNRYDKTNADIVVPYNDERMYFKIPDNEEVNNPNLYK